MILVILVILVIFSDLGDFGDLGDLGNIGDDDDVDDGRSTGHNGAAKSTLCPCYFLKKDIQVSNHGPVCSCPSGYQGDPLSQCFQSRRG